MKTANDTVVPWLASLKLFDEESARKYLEGRLWPNGVICPECGSGERITTRKDGYYRCNACKFDFTVRTGTIFERSHVALHKWLYAMYLLVTGISSMQLAKEIGITQKSAWFVLHRLAHPIDESKHVPPELERMTDAVLAYKPKPKTGSGSISIHMALH